MGAAENLETRPYGRNLAVTTSAAGSAESLTPVLSPIPEPGPGEVRIRVLTTTASRTDVLTRAGRIPGTRFPYTPGYELVGEIEAVGEGVDAARIGERVADLCEHGGNARFVCRPADAVVAIDPTIDPERGAAAILGYLSAYQMLHRSCRLHAGDTVLVHGGGGAVGFAAVELARTMGCEVVTTARAVHHERLEALGATVIDYTRENWVARARTLAPQGFAAVLDGVGERRFRSSHAVLRRGGTLVGYGFMHAAQHGGFVPLTLLMLLVLGLLGVVLRKRARFFSMQRAHVPEDLGTLMGMLARGEIHPRVAEVMPLEQAAEAHARVEAGVVGKIVLVP